MKSAVDVILGGQLAEARLGAGMTQAQLGSVLGVSQQMVHKYEHGSSPMSAEQLFRACHALESMPEAFFVPALQLIADE